MANAEIVVTRKHGNVFIGGQPIKINVTRSAEGGNTEAATLGSAKLGTMKLGAE